MCKPFSCHNKENNMGKSSIASFPYQLYQVNRLNSIINGRNKSMIRISRTQMISMGMKRLKAGCSALGILIFSQNGVIVPPVIFVQLLQHRFRLFPVELKCPPWMWVD